MVNVGGSSQRLTNIRKADATIVPDLREFSFQASASSGYRGVGCLGNQRIDLHAASDLIQPRSDFPEAKALDKGYLGARNLSIDRPAPPVLFHSTEQPIKVEVLGIGSLSKCYFDKPVRI